MTAAARHAAPHSAWAPPPARLRRHRSGAAAAAAQQAHACSSLAAAGETGVCDKRHLYWKHGDVMHSQSSWLGRSAQGCCASLRPCWCMLASGCSVSLA